MHINGRHWQLIVPMPLGLKSGYWPRATQACFRWWRVGPFELRRYYDVPWPNKA